MIKLLILLGLLFSVPTLTYSGCGDNVCGKGEDTRTCSRDCNNLGTPSEEYFVGNGPAIRGAPFRKGMVVGSVVTENKKAVLQFSIYDVNLKLLFKTDVLSRELTGKGELGNPHPLVGPDGVIYLAFRDHKLSGVSEPSYRLRVIKSQDNGRSWDYLDDLNSRDGFIDSGPEGLWEPFLYFDAENVMRVVYAKERAERVCTSHRGKKQDIVVRQSRDQGKTWSAEHIVASEGVSRDGVPAVTRLKDGSFVVVFESWQSSVCGRANPNLLIRSMQSPDGIEWKERNVVFDPYLYSAGRSLATWPFISVLKDGRALVSFTSNYRNSASAMEAGARPEEVKTFDVLLMASTGGAELKELSWDNHSLSPAFEYKGTVGISNRYASTIVLKDGRIVVFSGLPDRFVVLNMKGWAQ